MSANVQSTPFTDPNVLFEDMTAANDWRSSLVVPAAGASSQGVVYLASIPAESFPADASPVYYNITTVEGDSAVVVSKATIDNYKAQINALRVRLEALIAALKDSGAVAEV